MEQLCGKHNLTHAICVDGKYVDEVFMDEYTDRGSVTQLFIDIVHRGYNHELRKDILANLFPEEFGNA